MNKVDASPLLETRHLTVRFGGVEAISDLSLKVWAGEVLGIAGPNGAGKTTLFNAISGHVRPTSGTVSYKERDITGMAPQDVFHVGIARTFQNPEVIGTQSVHNNVLVGSHFATPRAVTAALTYSAQSYERAWRTLIDLGLIEQRDRLARTVPLYSRKLIMLGSALASKPEVLMLDEPVGGLTPAESQLLLRVIQKVKGSGTTVIVIEHVMRVLMALSDRLVILKSGKLLFDGLPTDARANAEVQRVYLGRERGSVIKR